MKTNKQEKIITHTKGIVGKVVSVSMQKSVVVEIPRSYHHPIYKKALLRSRRIQAHNELAGISLEDLVEIKETRPISKRKHFIVTAKLNTDKTL